MQALDEFSVRSEWGVWSMWPGDMVMVVMYFVFLLAAAVIASCTMRGPHWTPGHAVYPVVAVVAVAVTWYLILRFMKASWNYHGGSLMEWLDESPFFFEAYKRVSDSPGRWWWSSQLLAWVLTMTVFFYVEAGRRGVRHLWSYVWLGFGGAISACFPLFIVAITSRKATRGTPRLPALLFVSVLIGLVNVLVYTRFEYLSLGWKANLIVLHATLLAPAIGSAATVEGARPPTQRQWPTLAYALLAGACFAHRFHVTASMCTTLYVQRPGPAFFSKGAGAAVEIVGTLSAVVGQIVHYGFSGNCVASISFDVVFTTALSLMWMAFHDEAKVPRRVVAALIVCTPVVSIATTFPLYLAIREMYLASATTTNRNKSE